VMVDSPQEVWQNGTKVNEEANGGLPALVRGMFVDCSIQTIPSRSLVLIPKLALKPGNQLWQFETNADLVAEEPLTKDDPKKIGSNSVDPKKNPVQKLKLNLDEWSSGNVRILKDVKVISTIRLPDDRSQEYWIAEARPDLTPGSLAIVTPLANMIGDGTDKARHQKVLAGGKPK